MKPIARRLFVAATLAALPSRAFSQSTNNQDVSALLRRMAQVNAKLQTYSARAHVEVALHTFPFLSPTLDGTLYYKQPEQWRRIMRSTIALNGSYFNTQRMLEQYVQNAYFPEMPVQASANALESILAK